MNEFPGDLVETDRGAWAFVLYPLPAELGLDTPTVRQLARAERALGRLSGRHLPSPNRRNQSFLAPRIISVAYSD